MTAIIRILLARKRRAAAAVATNQPETETAKETDNAKKKDQTATGMTEIEKDLESKETITVQNIILKVKTDTTTNITRRVVAAAVVDALMKNTKKTMQAKRAGPIAEKSHETTIW